MRTPEPDILTFAITCDDCGIMMPVGTPVLYSAMLEYVHVVCPEKPEDSIPLARHTHLVTSEVIYAVRNHVPIPEHVRTQCCNASVAHLLSLGGRVTKYKDISTCGPLRKETAALRDKKAKS